MPEEPEIVKANVDRYRDLLKQDLDEAERAAIKRLLAQALEQLNSQKAVKT